MFTLHIFMTTRKGIPAITYKFNRKLTCLEIYNAEKRHFKSANTFINKV